MCGICGVTWNDTDACRKMMSAAAHRGPDQDGVYQDEAITLGHKRLSIIDLSDGGRQPMVAADGATAISFNGEVYNYRALRAQLEAEGHHFQTSSDTEVLLVGLGSRGLAFLNEIHGIFAFAHWDRKRRRLTLARDPIGVKPLYYCLRAEGLAFGSEIKQLTALPGSVAVLDVPALDQYLMFHYVPSDRTLLEGVKKLPPGCAASWQNGRLEITRYSTPVFGPEVESRPVDALERLLRATMDDQMVADVPIGSFLSGGVDSGVVTALAQEISGAAIHTFSVGFDEGLPNELAEARQSADALKTLHHETVVRGASVAKDFDRITWHLDEPVSEAGAIPNFYVAQDATRSVKVVLAGEGGDEVFGGYRWYAAMERLATLRRLVPRVGQRIGALLDPLPGDFGRRVRTVVQPRTEWSAFARLVSVAEPSYLARLRGERALDGTEAPFAAALDGARAIPSEARWRYVDVQTLLAECYLMKADKMTMAWGLEERVPLLAPKLVEFGMTYAHGAAGRDKFLLREVAQRLLPVSVARRPKRGYGVPIVAWAKGPFSTHIDAALDNSQLVKAGLLSATEVQRLRRRFRTDDSTTLMAWQVFALERWLKTFRVSLPAQESARGSRG